MTEVYKTELLKLSDKFKRVIAERETKQGEHRIASSDLYLKRASMSPLKRFARALSLSRKLSKLRDAESESKKAIEAGEAEYRAQQQSLLEALVSETLDRHAPPKRVTDAIAKWREANAVDAYIGHLMLIGHDIDECLAKVIGFALDEEALDRLAAITMDAAAKEYDQEKMQEARMLLEQNLSRREAKLQVITDRAARGQLTQILNQAKLIEEPVLTDSSRLLEVSFQHNRFMARMREAKYILLHFRGRIEERIFDVKAEKVMPHIEELKLKGCNLDDDLVKAAITNHRYPAEPRILDSITD